MSKYQDMEVDFEEEDFFMVNYLREFKDIEDHTIEVLRQQGFDSKNKLLMMDLDRDLNDLPLKNLAQRCVLRFALNKLKEENAINEKDLKIDSNVNNEVVGAMGKKRKITSEFDEKSKRIKVKNYLDDSIELLDPFDSFVEEKEALNLRPNKSPSSKSFVSSQSRGASQSNQSSAASSKSPNTMLNLTFSQSVGRTQSARKSLPRSTPSRQARASLAFGDAKDDEEERSSQEKMTPQMLEVAKKIEEKKKAKTRTARGYASKSTGGVKNARSLVRR